MWEFLGTALKKEQAGPVVNGLQLTLSADKMETLISKDGKTEKPVALKLTFTCFASVESGRTLRSG